MQKALSTGLLLGLCLVMVACDEQLETVKIVVNEGRSKNFILLDLKDDTTAVMDLQMTNRDFKTCRRRVGLPASDTAQLKNSLRQLEICDTKNWRPCRSQDEAYAVTTHRAGLIQRTTEVDILPMTCSMRSRSLCESSGKEVQTLTIMLLLAYGDPDHPEFNCR